VLRVVCGALTGVALMTIEGGDARAAVHCKGALPGASARLDGIDARTRLDWIDARLAEAGRHARVWRWAWGGGIAASGVASLAVVPFVRREDRVDWYTSAGSAAIGVVPFLVSPPRVAREPRERADAEARAAAGVAAASVAASDGEDRVCPLLFDAETRLARDAEDQRRQQTPWLHIGNVAFNTGVMLFLGLGFHHWTGGIINGVAGAAVGEAIILTQPTRSIDDLQSYRAGALGYGYVVAF
jgi:hypothetical protein